LDTVGDPRPELARAEHRRRHQRATPDHQPHATETRGDRRQQLPYDVIVTHTLLNLDPPIDLG